MRSIEQNQKFYDDGSATTLGMYVSEALQHYVFLTPNSEMIAEVIDIAKQYYLEYSTLYDPDPAFYLAVEDAVDYYTRSQGLEKESQNWQKFQQLRATGLAEFEALQLLTNWIRENQSLSDVRAAQLYEDEMKEFNADLNSGVISNNEYQTLATRALLFAEGELDATLYATEKTEFLQKKYKVVTGESS